MTLIEAAVSRDPGQPLVIEDVVLRAPGQGEVQVRVQAVAICHSDLGYLDDAWATQRPAVYGHEAAGVIEALGAGVTGLSVGQRVVVTMIRSCGQCRLCRTGQPALCTARHDRLNGVLTLPGGAVVEQGLDTGAFATAVCVHHSQLAPIPDDMPAELGALLACGVITGTGAAINTAPVRAGDTVVVIGTGGVGLNALQGARLAGAARIIAIDLSADKLAAARDFGATDTLAADMPKLRRAVMELTGGQGADVVLVCVGAIAAHQQAASLAAKGGTVVMVGMPPSGQAISVEPVIMAATAQTLKGSFMGGSIIQRDIPHLVAMWQQGRLKLEELITARYPFERINDAIADARNPDVRRNVVVME